MVESLLLPAGREAPQGPRRWPGSPRKAEAPLGALGASLSSPPAPGFTLLQPACFGSPAGLGGGSVGKRAHLSAAPDAVPGSPDAAPPFVAFQTKECPLSYCWAGGIFRNAFRAAEF